MQKTKGFQQSGVDFGVDSYALCAAGQNYDVGYRYFSPRMPKIWEDPVNGASQAALMPFWTQKLDKRYLHIRALSAQGGDLYCQLKNDTVLIGGRVRFLA